MTDVPDFALVARRIGWEGKAGRPLQEEADTGFAPSPGSAYIENEGKLRAA